MVHIGIGIGISVVHIGISIGIVQIGIGIGIVQIGIGIGLFKIGISIGIVQIGIGRHDSRLQHVHYDHAVVGSQFLHLSKGCHLQLSSYLTIL